MPYQESGRIQVNEDLIQAEQEPEEVEVPSNLELVKDDSKISLNLNAENQLYVEKSEEVPAEQREQYLMAQYKQRQYENLQEQKYQEMNSYPREEDEEQRKDSQKESNFEMHLGEEDNNE